MEPSVYEINGKQYVLANDLSRWLDVSYHTVYNMYNMAPRPGRRTLKGERFGNTLFIEWDSARDEYEARHGAVSGKMAQPVAA